jgi:2'-5' RNA ligase
MRMFVGVEIDDRARRVAAETAEALRAAIPARLEARWVTPGNFHLTARFIGQVQEGLVPDVLAALTRPLGVAPFDIELGGCGVFPPSGPPRAIWIGLAAGLPALAALHDEFDRRLARFGFEPERRPFTAHLTLARLKHAPRGASAAVRAVVARVTPVPAIVRVRHATVFESCLSPKGPRYEPLARAHLGSPAEG